MSNSASTVSDTRSHNESGDPRPHRNLKRHSEFCFDNTLVAILIEDTLFNVHKYQLLKSETFSDMFKVPKAKDGEPEEGSSLDYPIVMEGVKVSDFEALLKVLYASHFSMHQPEPEASLIIPAFRLANMWNFADLRAFLLPLAEKHLDDIDKILFAREFDIKDWMAPAHIRLCRRKEKLTTEEARKLGVDSVLLIARLGQQNPHAAGYTNNQCQGAAPINLVAMLDRYEWLQISSDSHFLFFIDKVIMSNNISISVDKSSSDMPSVPKARFLKRDDEFCFDNTLIAIQIEDTLFNIHKYQLLKSETFSDMFKVPKAEDGEPEEGSSLDHPIVMEGVKITDFKALLKVLYASHFSTQQPEPEASLIIPAFRLANMWNFTDLRAFLLPLAEKHLSDIDKIVFAREFGIDDWLVPMHIRLCQRGEKLTTEEARKLGVDSVLLLARLGGQGSPQQRLIPGDNYCLECIGFTYANATRTCNGCQGSSGYGANIKYTKPGNLMLGNQSSPSLESEVKKWVQDGCVFKD